MLRLTFIVLFLIPGLYPGPIAQTVTITPDKPDGIYRVGETVTWTIQCNGESPALRYVLKKGGLTEDGSGFLFLTDGAGHLTYTFQAPGTILLEVRWGGEDESNKRTVGGAVAEPERIALSAVKPKDFDAFWKAKLKELKRVPANPVMTKGESGKEGVDYWKMEMDNIRNTKIRGQLARPSQGEKFPALLIVQWAGVYPLHKDWAVSRAAFGWLVLNIQAHDLPIDESPEFYQEQLAGPLKSYWMQGNDDRETSYFLRMYLSCYRAAEYLKRRPDWNGKTLVVMGDSQGGQQALMTAGFHPSVTAAIANVPAGFDMLGPTVGRKGGWSQWYNNVEGKDPEKVRHASRYYDVANFVTRIKCPVLVGVGLLDETCPPEGILAGLNQLPASKKKVMILPKSAHQDRDGSQALFRDERDNVWLPALKEGKNVMPD